MPDKVNGGLANLPADCILRHIMRHDIRPADPTDPQSLASMQDYFAELAAIFPQGFDPGPLTEESLSSMRAPDGLFLLAFDGRTAIGCVGLRREDATTGEVKRLWVAPAARQSGLARALMAEIETKARTMGLSRLVLDTSRHLPKAVAFYHRQGWTEIARYNDNPYAHHFFEKRL
ncbi:GNAT family N-acetyltransferase [Thioclava sp. FR2]|uniref:GNAT family N-acetyltransferase n=1 Tax=Thioclava sp. FR2 TaxID=3445780 RepID=UPI003EB70CE8